MNPFSLSTFWAKWKIVIVLGGLLAASASLNLWQFGRLVSKDRVHAEQIKTASEKARADALAERLGIIESMREQKVKDDKVIADLLLKVEEKKVETVVQYRDRVRTVEVPVCKVIDLQVDEVNSILRGN